MPVRAALTGARIAGPVAVIVALGLAVAMPAAARAPVKRKAVANPVQIRAVKIPGATYPGLGLTPAVTTGPTHRGPVKVVYYVTVTVKVRYKVKVKVKTKHGHKFKFEYKYKLVQRREKRTKFPIRTIQSKQEWMVLSGGLESDLVSVTPTGTIRTVVPSLLPSGTVPAGQLDYFPSYGSVQVGNRVWVIDYSSTPATLYAVGPAGGAASAVTTIEGSISSITAGPDNTIEAADNDGYIDRCAITAAPSASCAQVKVPTTFAGGQIDAVAQGGGRVWFTDDYGELGSFNPATEAFAGPYGDIAQSGQKAGEASALPGTIVATSNKRMYVAAGQDTNPLFQNNLIRVIDPRHGTLLHTYSHGLTNVIAMTEGSDGNIWFLDQTNAATGAGKVGVLNTTSGLIGEFALPKGYRLPATGAAIADGPAGSDTLFLNLETVQGTVPAIGEVTETVPATTAKRRRAGTSKASALH